MKRNIREKLIRIILSAILSSDLTNKEIHSISNSLNKNEGIFGDLREILRDIANKLDIYSNTFSKPYNTFPLVNERIDMALDIIKRKRIPKNKIINYIDLISPNDSILHDVNNITVRALIEEYFNSKSENTQSKFIEFLETSGKGGDEYLKGIMNRR